MTPRTLLAIGAAVVALVVGGTTVDHTTGSHGADVAVAAEITPTAAPRVTAAKLKHVDSVELGAESLVLRNGSKTVVVASMRDSRTTVDLLRRLLGTPSRSQTAEGEGGACFPAGTTYTWGGALRVAALSSPAELGNAIEVRVLRDEVRSRTGDLVELTGPDGVQVGDDVDARIHDTPAAERDSFGSGKTEAWQLLLAEGWPSDRDGAGRNGVSALTDGTTVTVIGSPMPVNATRSC